MAQRYKKEVVFELPATISKTTSKKSVVQPLISEIHKIGIVNAEVEAATGHVEAGAVGREGTELELA